MRDFTRIKAWQKADDLTVAIYRATRGFPRDERFALTSQLRRAAYSAPANVAEGAARESKKDYLHFLYIARASLSEARYFLHLSRRLDYLDQAAYEPLVSEADEAGRMLGGLIRAVEQESNSLTRTAARLTSLLAPFLPYMPLRSVLHPLS